MTLLLVHFPKPQFCDLASELSRRITTACAMVCSPLLYSIDSKFLFFNASQLFDLIFCLKNFLITFFVLRFQASTLKPISSPVPEALYPTLSVVMLAIGLVVTASFFMWVWSLFPFGFYLGSCRSTSMMLY